MLWVGLVCLTAACLHPSAQHLDDWRLAVGYARQFERSSPPLLLFNGLIESADPDWLACPEHSEYMTASVRYYGWKNQVRLLPWFPSVDAHTAYLHDLCDSLEGRQEIPVVVRNVFIVTEDGERHHMSEAIGAYFEDAGFAVRETHSFHGVTVIVLTSRQ